jgi:hypothetical protein
MTETPEYEIWCGIKKRCSNPQTLAYKNYGGRGITICERWQDSFEAFFADMGPRPSPQHSIERKNNALGYSPNNCIWATATIQGRNKRTNRLLTLHGQTFCLQEWAERTGLSHNTILRRKLLGWSDEKALTTPVRIMHKRQI